MANRTFAAMSPLILIVRAPHDAVLHHIAPLGAAAALGTALVVDLDDEPTSYGAETLAGLAADGVRRRHLEPERPGVAVLGRGPIERAEGLEMIGRLAQRWPALVVRSEADLALPGSRTVTVRTPLPGSHAGRGGGLVVWQRVSHSQRVPQPSLPPPGRSRATDMLAGRIDPRWRWVRAWRPIWGMAWA